MPAGKHARVRLAAGWIDPRGLFERNLEQAFQKETVERAQLGVGGQERSIGAAAQQDARPICMRFPTSAVSVLVEKRDCLVEALGGAAG